MKLFRRISLVVGIIAIVAGLSILVWNALGGTQVSLSQALSLLMMGILICLIERWRQKREKSAQMKR